MAYSWSGRENNCKGPLGSLLRWGNFPCLDCGSYTIVCIYQNSSSYMLEMEVLFYVNTLMRILLCAWHYCLLLNSEDMLLYIKCKNGFICQWRLIRKSYLRETSDWWAYLKVTELCKRGGESPELKVMVWWRERRKKSWKPYCTGWTDSICQLIGGKKRIKGDLHILGNWEDHDTIKMSNATFAVRHLLTVLFKLKYLHQPLQSKLPILLPSFIFHCIIYDLRTTGNVFDSFALLFIHSHQSISSREVQFCPVLFVAIYSVPRKVPAT